MRCLRLILLACLIPACHRHPRFSEPRKLGGQIIPAATLNEGYEVYSLYCRACHGENGDGNGPAAPGMRPPPRNFAAGPALAFKFGGVAPSDLPNDEDLITLIKNGLPGTPMLAWDMSDRERHAVVQYIKTFSERWAKEPAGDRIVPDIPDPWLSRDAAGIERGRNLYHLSGVELDSNKKAKGALAGCVSCHPSYLTRKEMTALSIKLAGQPMDFRPDQYRSARDKESEYTVGGHKIQFLPTDFLFHRVKNGVTNEALFRTIAAGIGGTAMPQWKGVLPDADIWALVHYVRYLMDLRDTTAAAALKATLAAQ